MIAFMLILKDLEHVDFSEVSALLAFHLENSLLLIKNCLIDA